MAALALRSAVGLPARHAPLMQLRSALRALGSLRARHTKQHAPLHTELRIDVAPSPDEVEAELRQLQQRFDARLHAQCTALALPLPGLRCWHREADGEHHVYVQCLQARRLVGHVVLNRLVEVSRSLDPHLRSPHTRITPAFQGCGIASAVYRWALDAGLCLVSGARQSAGAQALWTALGRHYHLTYVHISRQELRLLGPQAPMAVREQLETRRMLFGVAAQP